MGIIVSSCGHEGTYKVCWIKIQNEDGTPSAVYTTLCSKCYRKAKKRGYIIENLRERNDYLGGKLPLKNWKKEIKNE